jgi:hypothetical protein
VALAPKLSVCEIIVETHDLETANAMQILEGRLSSTHTIERIPKVAETRTGFPSCSRGRSWIDGWSSAKRGRKV